MNDTITPENFDFLLGRAGLVLTEAQKAELIRVYPMMAAMAERLRVPLRGREAEPAHVFSAAR